MSSTAERSLRRSPLSEVLRCLGEPSSMARGFLSHERTAPDLSLGGLTASEAGAQLVEIPRSISWTAHAAGTA